MTESTNYKFKLPSSADGAEDIADINVISGNFSSVDEILHDLDSGSTPCTVCPTSISLDVNFPQGIYKTTSTCTITNAKAEDETVTIPANCVFSYTRSMSVGEFYFNGSLIMLKGSMNAGGAGEQIACYVTGEKTMENTWDYTFEFNSKYVTSANINKKQNTLVSGTNIKTINNQSILGSGNITIESGEAIQEITITGHIVTAEYLNGLDFSRYKLTSSDGEHIIIKLRTGEYDPNTYSRATEDFTVYDSSMEFNITTTLLSAIKSKVINFINGYVAQDGYPPEYDTIILPGQMAYGPDTPTRRIYEYEVDEKIASRVGDINQVLATLVDVTTA